MLWKLLHLVLLLWAPVVTADVYTIAVSTVDVITAVSYTAAVGTEAEALLL